MHTSEDTISYAKACHSLQQTLLTLPKVQLNVHTYCGVHEICLETALRLHGRKSELFIFFIFFSLFSQPS